MFWWELLASCRPTCRLPALASAHHLKAHAHRMIATWLLLMPAKQVPMPFTTLLLHLCRRRGISPTEAVWAWTV